MGERIRLFLRLINENSFINIFIRQNKVIFHHWFIEKGLMPTGIKNNKFFSVFYLKNRRLSYRD